MLHIDIPSRHDIESLSTTTAPGCVSIYLPTTPVTVVSDADRILFKNLAREAVGAAESAGLARGDADALKESFDDLLDDEDFWEHQACSLAVFATPEGVRTFRLPNTVDPVSQVADRFFIKPLLYAMTTPQTAFVLALAQGGVRVVEVSSDLPAYTLDIAEMPTDVASAAGLTTITDRSPSGRIQGSEGQKVRMRQYARKVDGALRDVLVGRDTPLILAATAPIDAIFRSVNTYPFLVEQTIEGNPEKLTDAELAQLSRPILNALHAERLARFAEEYGTAQSQGLGTSDVAEAASAATRGAISTLLVDIDASVEGAIDEAGAYSASAADGGYQVIDEIARRTLATGGTVLAVRSDDLPAGTSNLAAVLRFAL